MAEPRCGGCVHWRRESWHDERWGFCSFVTDERPEDTATDHSVRARAWDYEGYSAGLDTRDDFACVEWRERTT